MTYQFRHFDDNALKLLGSTKMVQSFPKFESFDGLFKSCQERKIYQLPFPSTNNWRAKEKMEIVHIDICGSIQTLYFGNRKYLILFIDDFSRMT